MADNNPPYFPLSTQAHKIKEALLLDDERLWNALRRRVKQACYAMVKMYKEDQQPERDLPTWTEFPNHLLQQARERVLEEDRNDGSILQRPNGQAALDWLFGTAYNNMKREMARGKPRDRPGSPDGPPRSPMVGHPQESNIAGLPDFAGLPPLAGASSLGGISGRSTIITPHHGSALYNGGIHNHTLQTPRNDIGSSNGSEIPRLPPQHDSSGLSMHLNGTNGYPNQSNNGNSDHNAPSEDHIQEARDSNGNPYFYNRFTNASSWNRNDPGLR